MKRKTYIIFGILIITLSLVTAQNYSMDISGLNTEEYNPGEEITFKIILLENGKEIERQVSYTLNDALNKKEISNLKTSNKETSLKIENDFPSGIWTIKATYQDSEITRTFTVGENLEIEFLIEADSLIIRNKGNTRYTKTIQIIIGSKTNSYAQNIKAGGERNLKLVSADGKYNIEVTDETTTIKKTKELETLGASQRTERKTYT